MEPPETVRVKLLKGNLRQDRHESTWAGKGSGQRCDGCDGPIIDSDIEIEADFPDRETLRFHQACFDRWCHETEKNDGRVDHH
jgi:hypothetical protein